MLDILCVSYDFGFGPAGKMVAILEELQGARPHVFDSQYFRVIMDESLRSRCSLASPGESLQDFVERVDPDAALVVLDTQVAIDLTEFGIPVVYVDSLPHLWSEKDPIPYQVRKYCAQKVGGITERPTALQRVKNFTWVDSVTNVAHLNTNSPREDGLALVNLGGVGSPMMSVDGAPYPLVVLPPVVSALRDEGYKVCVAGNVDQDLANALGISTPPPRQRFEFLELMQRASVLFTSPGMTTLLEAGSLRVPTVLLPPQNLSQIRNADRVGAERDVSLINWPDSVINSERIKVLNDKGEEACLQYIYDAIESAIGDSWIAAYLDKQTRRLVSSASSEWLHAYAMRMGNKGAAQVASEVLKAAGVRIA